MYVENAIIIKSKEHCNLCIFIDTAKSYYTYILKIILNKSGMYHPNIAKILQICQNRTFKA